jgi:prepilin-type N-terminal cleavage/methylation domain-containing protein
MRKGFTLIELIIVIAIIAILAAAIFVAVDPARRLHEARNARRANDIATILDAVKQYQADNGGAHYSEIENLAYSTYYQIGIDASGCDRSCGDETTDETCVNLSGIGSNYLSSIPYDPQTGNDIQTAYALSVDSNGSIAAQACDAEGEGPGGNDTPPVIKVTR